MNFGLNEPARVTRGYQRRSVRALGPPGVVHPVFMRLMTMQGCVAASLFSEVVRLLTRQTQKRYRDLKMGD